jgi:hypothetical protein
VAPARNSGESALVVGSGDAPVVGDGYGDADETRETTANSCV